MEDLNKFVDEWEKTKNIEALIAQNFVLPPSDEVQAYLSTLPADAHERIRTSLTEAMAALSSHTLKMEEEAISLQSQIEQNLQSSNAALAYNKTPRKRS